MSFAAINWAWEQLDLPPGPKVVLMGLAHVADDTNMACIGMGGTMQNGVCIQGRGR